MALALSSLELKKQEGLQKGLQKGLQEGLQKGLQKGEQKGVQETAKKMLKDDLDMKVIAKYTGLSQDRLNELKDKLQ